MTEKEAFYTLTYGLFLLTTTDGERQNGCIVNTASMLTDNPKRIVVFVNRSNYSAELLRRTKICNISVLTEKTPFETFRRFGFVSGRDTDKFAGGRYATSENGLYYLQEYANAVIGGKVTDIRDYDTHTLFVLDVTEAKRLSDEPSMTYAYYQTHLKPKPTTGTEASPKDEATPSVGKWVCKVCGYEYEGEALPEDFVCPWCKHPAEDFERVR